MYAIVEYKSLCIFGKAANFKNSNGLNLSTILPKTFSWREMEIKLANGGHVSPVYSISDNLGPHYFEYRSSV